MASKGSEPAVIVALDFPDAGRALECARRLSPAACRVKVGNELYTAAGPAAVEDLQALGFDVFLDLKYHDIPNTVAGACTAAARLGCWMINVHASGGHAMIRAAREALAGFSDPPWLIAVTVLTSLDQETMRSIGLAASLEHTAFKLADLARSAGADGVVCSPLEAAAMRSRFGADFRLVTPGIRPLGAAPDDQSRIASPRSARAGGADYLVIGRPITRAGDPMAALAAINAELTGHDGASPV